MASERRGDGRGGLPWGGSGRPPAAPGGPRVRIRDRPLRRCRPRPRGGRPQPLWWCGRRGFRRRRVSRYRHLHLRPEGAPAPLSLPGGRGFRGGLRSRRAAVPARRAQLHRWRLRQRRRHRPPRPARRLDGRARPHPELAAAQRRPRRARGPILVHRRHPRGGPGRPGLSHPGRRLGRLRQRRRPRPVRLQRVRGRPRPRGGGLPVPAVPQQRRCHFHRRRGGSRGRERPDRQGGGRRRLRQRWRPRHLRV